ncbi:YhjD/YihY/BrkB family envelope integrity protein [Streptomyces sp. NPDC060048]|uniref:YhjD/YihY/BrkB family envelope integrity protein n=1 Tax=unclassified Streptomyces TaxID=2593676 RepID=UPI00368AB962
MEPGNRRGDGADGDVAAPAPEEKAAGRRRALRPSWWRGKSRDVTVTARRMQRGAEVRFPVITHLTARMISVNILDAATRLAAQCFLTAVPLLFVFGSFAPQGVQDQLLSSVRAVFGLTGGANEQLEQVYRSGTESLQEATGFVGSLMVLLSATAVSRAMQRLCKRAWNVPKGGTKVAPWRWLVWITVWLSVLVVQAPLRDGFGVGLWLGIPVTLLCQTALWWWSQHLLLGGAIPWLPLLPGAVITAVSITALSLGAQIYMPVALNRTLAEYGSLGPVFTVLSWLIVVCAAVALSITAGAVLAQETGLAHRLGSPPAPRGPEEGPAGRL